MKIHKEGYKIILSFIVVFIVILVVVNIIFPAQTFMHLLLYLFAIISSCLVALFFRVPLRNPPLSDNHVISGADGKVVAIEEVYEQEYFNDKRIQVSVFMSVINVHVNFTPISGIVKHFKYHSGKHFYAWSPKSSLQNERTTTVIENFSGVQILVRQIAGAFARRIICFAPESNEVKQGELFGIIKFGSRVDILLPLKSEIKVQLKQQVKGGETIIAVLQH